MKTSAAAQVRVGQGSVGTASSSAAAEVPAEFVDHTARGEVIRQLLTDGPSTAAHLAQSLHISGTAVRRQLDLLVTDGSVSYRHEAAAGRRGRGRPAKVYLLTDVGRRRLPHAYDDLAEDALEYLATHVGTEAVERFARQRALRIVASVRSELDAADSVAQRMRILAKALSGSGFAPSVDEVNMGQQLSQHHCPVSHVAGKYPQLCEQELAVFTEVLGTYTQRLATIARGDSFCTTFVPDALMPDDLAPDAPHQVAGPTSSPPKSPPMTHASGRTPS